MTLFYFDLDDYECLSLSSMYCMVALNCTITVYVFILFILHGLPCNTSAKEFQIQDDIVTLDALLHKFYVSFD